MLAKNGLDNGKVYVLGSVDPEKNKTADFKRGAVGAKWIEIPDAFEWTRTETRDFAAESGAFQFVRLEDVDFRPDNPNECLFLATGGVAGCGNEWGRMYRLHLNADDPAGSAELEIIYNADLFDDAAGNFLPAAFFNALSPDNLAANDRFVMVQEDRNGTIQSLLNILGRDGSIYSYDMQDNFAAKREAELNQPNRFGVTQNLGRWESSGIIDASAVFGPNTWLTNVQAHGGIPEEEEEFLFKTPEDGQVLILRPKE
ncbi:MAG: hypothetical protein AAF514_24560, partial [Verrucomicrobiota bacterium]